MPDRYWPLHRVAGQEDVWVARDEATGEEVVMKRMERETNSDYEELNQQIIQEAHTHKELAEACPERIIGYRNFYLDDEGYYCLIMDRADCTVSDLLQMRGCLAEQDAQVLVHALLEGLEFMHKRYILHRDLKPSNLFLVDRQDLNSLRLADFGISAEENGYSNVGGVKGTNGYMAPEVLKKTLYGRPVDMWSTGIITYQILRGRLPWIGNPSRPSERLVHSNIMKEDGLTDDAKSFITSLLRVEPPQRLTATQALNHPWMRSMTRRAMRAVSQPPKPHKLQVVPEYLDDFEGWVRLWQANGPPYYFHEPTGTTQWTHPRENDAQAPASSPDRKPNQQQRQQQANEPSSRSSSDRAPSPMDILTGSPSPSQRTSPSPSRNQSAAAGGLAAPQGKPLNSSRSPDLRLPRPAPLRRSPVPDDHPSDRHNNLGLRFQDELSAVVSAAAAFRSAHRATQPAQSPATTTPSPAAVAAAANAAGPLPPDVYAPRQRPTDRRGSYPSPRSSPRPGPAVPPKPAQLRAAATSGADGGAAVSSAHFNTPPWSLRRS